MYLIFTFREFKSIHKGKTAILHLCFGTEKNRRLGSKKARYIRAFRRRHLFCLHIMVGVARLELAASWSRTMRATICATPRCSFFIIMITHTVVKYQFSFLQRNMRNLSILVFGRNVSFCYFHLDSIPESHYNKTTAVSPVLQTLLTTSLETVHCCQSPFFFLSMPRRLSRHFYGGRYRTRTCDPPHVKRMLIPAELIVRVSVGYSNASASFCQPLFSTAPIIFGAVEHGALYFAVI